MEFSASITRACALQTIRTTYHVHTYVRDEHTYTSSISWHSCAQTKKQTMTGFSCLAGCHCSQLICIQINTITWKVPVKQAAKLCWGFHPIHTHHSTWTQKSAFLHNTGTYVVGSLCPRGWTKTTTLQVWCIDNVLSMIVVRLPWNS